MKEPNIARFYRVVPYLIRNPGGVVCLDSGFRRNDGLAYFHSSDEVNIFYRRLRHAAR
ncbi:MAG: hypothetical protein HY671_05305 [Chloroflexi bacterium]|nr:hypothetical protein [Chloroflexota bacterium]